MDKYTIDLDQVLNDFEYLELTDQHSRNVSEQPHNSNNLSSPVVTKHSINNVFHSLNEYLNTSISNKRVCEKETNRIEDLHTDKNVNSVSPMHSDCTKVEKHLNNYTEGIDFKGKQQTESTEGKIDYIKTSNEDPKLPTSAILPNNTCDDNKDTDAENIDLKSSHSKEIQHSLGENTNIINNSTLMKTDIQNCLLQNEEPTVYCKQEANDNDVNYSNNDKTSDCIANKAITDIEENSVIQVNEPTVADNCDIKDDNSTLNMDGVLIEVSDMGSNESYVIEPSNSLHTMDLQLGNEAVEKSYDSECANLNHEKNGLLDTINREEDTYIVSNTASMENEIEDLLSNKIDNTKQESKGDCKVVESNNAIIVGFSADIDIDENELTEMLKNLEQEDLDDQESPLIGEKVAIENETKIYNSVPISNFIEDNIENTSITKEDNSFEKHTEHNIINVGNNDEVENETKEDNVTEPLKTAEENNIELITNNTEKADEHLEPTENASGYNLKDDKVGECEEQLEKDHSQDSLTRPQNLPLKNELQENGHQIGRKIDLIGSPGSTPYNNVYINQSIQPKNLDDSDSDGSTSASPTFSDCSAESTTTASTVSVEDENKEVNSKTDNADSNSLNDESKTSHKNLQVVDDIAINNDKSVEDTVGVNISKNNENSSQITTDSNPGHEVDITNQGGGDTSNPLLDKSWLGKQAPLWIPDSDAIACLHCDMKFTVLKRRHHCRACGLVLCSKCCNLKFRLDYMNAEARVCNKCFDILNRDTNSTSSSDHNTPISGNSPSFRPNPNNPLEYCSTVSPLQQVGQGGSNPPSVMVPVGVLKRKGSNKKSNKSVMFCDGIAPGSDLTNLDQDFNYNPDLKLDKSTEDSVKKKEKIQSNVPSVKTSRNQPKIDQETGCYIPASETSLPPTISINKNDILYSECSNSPSVVEMLKNETLTFAINQNLFVHVKIINMDCCINKYAWCFSTEGLINVGSEEVIYLLEYIDEESFVPKDLFFHIHNVYTDAVKGTSLKELGLSLHNRSVFLDSRNHAGFVYIRPTFQCLDKVIKPKEAFLIGILIHRWETPWAKLFPLRLILRLGAEYRYYPSPIISTRYRDSVFVEIGHTIINLLADFRNFTFTLPEIKGLIIHMEEKKTTITIPKNRYEQVIKSINNSSEHILAFAGNFSAEADSHLVCIQNTQDHENLYTTHAINIHNKPRKLTGASFIVFNGSLKSSTGLTAKSNIVEDGLMVQIPSEHLEKIREDLRNLKNHTIPCGCINVTSDETVNIVWGENDTDFNVGVQSPVDLADMKGVPSIRVHNGKDYFCSNGTKHIRWTEVFILKNGEENSRNQDPVDISKVSESIAKACCNALVKYLDLLVSNSCQKIGIRATLHVENVSYSAGANGIKLPPIYMRSLDNELIPVLHRITTNSMGDNIVILELIFRILNS